MTFRRRTFPEVLDALLVAVTGGVAAEPYPFPPDGGGVAPAASGPNGSNGSNGSTGGTGATGAKAAPIRHGLQTPASALVSVYGSRGGAPHEFRRDVDYALVDPNTMQWQPKAELPDRGTLISINYYPSGVRPVLTDLQVGSVMRTLLETTAREIAALSAQLEQVYRSGFVDSAAGGALDNVVALLGLRRVTGGRAVGEVEFTRSPGTPGTITIPAGTRVMTADGAVSYETTATVTLAAGQGSIRIGARDLETNRPLAAGTLTVMPVPIAGVVGVTNPSPTAMSSRDEADEDLRTRAKNFLHGSERATLGALVSALASEGITADVEELGTLDASGQVGGTPGVVEITPHAESMTPEAQQRLLTAIDAARPAGVLVRLKGAEPPAKLDLDLRLVTRSGLLEQDLRATQRAVRDQVAKYLQRLPLRSAGSLSQLAAAVMSVAGVQDVRIAAASLSGTGTDVLDASDGTLALAGIAVAPGEIRITDPSLPTSLDLVVTYPASDAQPDQAAIERAIRDAVAYLNDMNAASSTPSAQDAAKRTLSFGRLLLPVPLPNRAGVSLASFDQATSPPALPDQTNVAPYVVRFVITQESGVSTVLAAPSDPGYELAPSERLTVTTVQVTQASGDG